ncbi:histone H3.v1-like [Jatropha curcas]|uniref:histone H3.v1-like n=1 Tax=Jatropha curcas TaxID=180498 RepID=UPI001892D487|nr:histone H3.v1-like [Jatropha curcas]
MVESSSNSLSDSLTEQELQLLRKLSKKYEQKESKEKKAEEKTKKRKIETATSQKQVAKARDKVPKGWMNFCHLNGWMNFLSLNELCYESLVKEFYGSLKVNGTESISVKLQGETRELSYNDFGKIFDIPNAGSRVTKIKDVSGVSNYKKEDFVKKIVKKFSADKQGSIECSNLTESMKWLYKLIVHYIYPKSASLTTIPKPLNLCHIIFDKLQNNPKKLPYEMILTPVFEFLDVNLDEHKRKEKGKAKLSEIEEEEEEKSEERSEEKVKEEEKKSEEKAGEEKEETEEEERKEEIEKESAAEKEELEEEETDKKKESEKSEKGKKAEEDSDAETEKIEISDEEKTTEDKTEQSRRNSGYCRLKEVGS